MPSILAQSVTFAVGASLSFFTLRYKTSSTRLDFPEPDTPVMQTSMPSGISTSIFFRLLARAPLILIARCATGLRLRAGNGIVLRWLR